MNARNGNSQQFAETTVKGRNDCPTPALQVESSIDSTCYAVDTLESIVGAILRRLEPVTGGVPPDEKIVEGTEVCLVPIAARIRNIERRIRSLNSDLEIAMNTMQI